MDRNDALKAIRERVKNDNLVRHMLATEAIMRAMATRFGGDVEEWGLAGLLHDIDVELVGGDMREHSRLGAEAGPGTGRRRGDRPGDSHSQRSSRHSHPD